MVIWMKKIIEEVVKNEKIKRNNKKTSVEKTVSGGNPLNNSLTRGVEDRELEKVLANLTTTIKVVGCGGAGTNTISRCLEGGINGKDLVAINTDAQHLLDAHAPHKILIGRHLTKGLGAGSIPRIGEDAAKESEQDIRAALGHSDMIFVTCGLGGGTGTGSAPVVAQIAKETG